MNTPTPTPTNNHQKISESEASQFELTSYVLFARTHACAQCSAIQNYSDLFEVWTHPTKTARSNAKILKAAKLLAPGFPISTVTTPTINVPLCNECLDTTTPTNRVFPETSYSAWADTLQRKAQQTIDDRRAATKAKQEPELDML